MNPNLVMRRVQANASKALSKTVMSHEERHLDNIYLNIVFQNTTANEIPAKYNVTKTIPIVDKPSDYYLAVVRMDVPLNGVPLLVVPIEPDQGDPNLTPMIFYINSSSKAVEYVADNNYTAPMQNQMTQVVTPYYYVYSFGNLIDMFNTAISTAYTAAGSPGGAGAPYFVFNPTTQLILLNVPVAFIAASATISFNTYAANYLDGFRATYNATTNLYTLVTKNTGINGFSIPGQTIVVANPPTWLSVSQEFVTMEYWLNLRKIVLTSNTIPVSSEYIPAYEVTGHQSGVSLSKPIITDFVPNIENAADSQSVAVYNPSAQYRLIDLIGDLPLNNIDLQIFWTDKTGNYYPMMIEPLQQASVKLGFFRKDLYHK